MYSIHPKFFIPPFQKARREIGCGCRQDAPVGLTITVSELHPLWNPDAGEPYPFHVAARCFACRSIVYDLEYEPTELATIDIADCLTLSRALHLDGCPHGWWNIYLTTPISEKRCDWLADGRGVCLAWCRTCRRVYKPILDLDILHTGLEAYR